MRSWFRIAVVCLCGFAIALAVTNAGSRADSSRVASRQTQGKTGKRTALHAYGRLPLAFVSNTGQLDRRVRFSAQAGGASFFFTRSEAAVALAKGKRGLALQLRFLGAERRPVLSGARPASGRVSYLLGNKSAGWRRNLATYGELVYRRLWPGIAMHIRGRSGRLEYEFRLGAGADPSRIRLAYRGEHRLALGSGGALRIATSLGVLRDLRPVSYQQIDGRRVPVRSRFVIGRNGSYGFALGAYNRHFPLVIDPGLVYSTYLGGSGSEHGYGVAVDGTGSAYVSGETSSADFPTTAGAFQTTSSGAPDAFVTKLNPTGTALEYSTYLGGSGDDFGYGIAVNGGNAYVTGLTDSSDFPTTSGAFQTSLHGPSDAFVAELNSTGTALDYSTYLGGSGYEDSPDALSPPGIAVDGTGSAYVTGFTSSADFPTTAGAFQTSMTKIDAAFVTKLNPTGTALDYSTYLGGDSQFTYGQGIAVDSAGNAYITGQANGGFPTTSGAFQTSDAGGSPDAFVTKLNASGTALDYSTFLGGTSYEYANGIAVDGTGNAYITGRTYSTDFPTTAGAFQTSLDGGTDAFVSKLNSTGTALDYSTYLGGNNYDVGYGIAVDGLGSAYVTGDAQSTDFPTTTGAFQTSSGGTPAFVTKLSPSGTALDYSTYLGGSSAEDGFAVAVGGAGVAYVTGDTYSSDFPTTAGAFQTSMAGRPNAFVTKLDLTASEYLLSVGKAGTGAGTVTSSPTGVDCGTTCSHDYASGTSVTLTAAAAAGSTFAGWSGACSGTGTCKVTMSAARSVTATFALMPAAACVVPKVKGKTLAAAKRAIKGAGCSVGKVKRATSKKVKKGHVISQKPKPHTRLTHGAKVNLVVSKGR